MAYNYILDMQKETVRALKDARTLLSAEIKQGRLDAKLLERLDEIITAVEGAEYDK